MLLLRKRKLLSVRVSDCHCNIIKREQKLLLPPLATVLHRYLRSLFLLPPLLSKYSLKKRKFKSVLYLKCIFLWMKWIKNISKNTVCKQRRKCVKIKNSNFPCLILCLGCSWESLGGYITNHTFWKMRALLAFLAITASSFVYCQSSNTTTTYSLVYHRHKILGRQPWIRPLPLPLQLA